MNLFSKYVKRVPGNELVMLQILKHDAQSSGNVTVLAQPKLLL